MGYLPQQLLSESLYSYVHADDALMLKKCFQEAILTSPAKVKTCEYRVRLENNKSYASVESVLFALKNPFTNILENIVLQNKFCSANLINQTLNQQQQSPIQKKKLIQSPMAFVSMPMTPSPEDNQNSELVKYNDTLLSKKIANNFRPNKSNQLNTAISFNCYQKMKQKDSLFQLDSQIDSNQFNALPIAASNQKDIFKQSRHQDDSFLNFNGNQENNLFNENNQNQIIYEITDNFNDFLVKNQQSTSGDVRSMEKRQNSYNLMMKNNSVQENTDMLMEILKNEKNFQTSLHSNSSNQKT